MAWDEAIALLDTIPGVDRKIAEDMLAEMGLDMSQYPTDKHLASWAGLAPGNRQSGGKRYSGRTRHMLTYRQPYRELGSDYFDQRRKEAKVSYFTRQLEKLTGGSVRIELQTTPAQVPLFSRQPGHFL